MDAITRCACGAETHGYCEEPCPFCGGREASVDYIDADGRVVETDLSRAPLEEQRRIVGDL